MSPIIELKNITKEYKILNRHEGLLGSMKDLFSREYNVSATIEKYGK